MPKGQIRKALSGFYYVYSEGETYQTRGRGNFRVRDITPLVGDIVEFESGSLTDGMLHSIYPRKNELVRPPIANIDIGVIVMSAIEPDFSTYLLDRFLVYLEGQEIEAIIYITKTDLLDESQKLEVENYKKAYQELGYTVIMSDFPSEESLTRLLTVVKDKIVVFMGQSGVGKSTLLNQILPELKIKTGEISTALGRGRHTTRHVELIPVAGALIADTPGFSNVELVEIEEQNLPDLFREFLANRDECRFSGCLHLNEPGCRIKELVAEGEIMSYRYEHYLQFLNEIQTRKPMYNKNKK
ncbi:Putative ribosome biogenesis GTPase RsgA [Jeotgalibaca dankookensis]|uniref:Small ribosomal subunit biogenesis GTPase RsgA n=1 Tax=Jeotgalibaca dankookensis TaxID=708126 RepID=A0A1S6IN27_9LACT|nr:ribosome small subunit-dependent GTPase A [Jeotgalibaca dankookensis]AQS52943.1 Putative ribosome biogenesis GTPase RsgA [Jeotgalibaca dankookensis]